MSGQDTARLWPQNGVFALAIRDSVEESGLRRRGILFEIVPADVVQPFLQRDSAPLDENCDPRLKTALQAWLEHKPGDGRFHRAKLPLLGAQENVGQLQVWFDDDALAEEFEIQSWYFAAAGGDYDCKLELPLDAEEENTRCTLQLLSETEQEALNELYRVRDFGDDAGDGSWFQLDSGTSFWSAKLFYVGAALCVGIQEAVWCDDTQTWGMGPIVAFFDLGFASGASCADCRVRRMAPTARANKTQILHLLRVAPNKTIIFSHLHTDHVSMCRSLNSDTYGPLFQHAEWYAPEGVSVVFQSIIDKVDAAGGTMNIINNRNPAQAQTWQLNGNPCFHIGKIDAFTGNTLAERCSHHHGIYVRVDLVSGENVLLVGDCTYCGIPGDEKQNITYLQACHHGGNYALPPVPQDGREREIPQPDPQGNRLICSANGYTYGHPNPGFLRDHYNQGWRSPAIVLRNCSCGCFICR